MNGRPPSPPRLAALLVRVLPADGNEAFLASDIEQEFDELAATAGIAAARRWYWKQACLSVRPLIGRHVSSTIDRVMRRHSRGRNRTMQALGNDLQYAWRMARRAPIVTVSVMLAIALGIAASTAMFSVMEGVFLRPLPFPAPDRLVRFSTTVEHYGVAPEVNVLDAQDWRSATRLERLGLYDVEPGTVRLAAGAPPFSATVMAATSDVVPALGLRAHLGRLLLPEEYQFGGPESVMLGYRFWQSHFGSDPSVVGRSLQLGTVRRTIVGVLVPEADRFPAGGADIWSPLTFPASSFLNTRGSIALAAIGRIRSETTIAAAQDELSTIAARLATAYPETNRARRVVIEDLQHAMVGPVKPMLLLLTGAIAMLLAVACANIANLLLAQAHARSLELGIRAAVGASSGRLARQLWTESLALFGVAGAIGVALAQPLALALITIYPDTLPLAADVQLDARVLAIAMACTLTAALVAGLPRMRRVTDTQPGAALRGDARSGLTKEHRRTTTMFVAAQVALSIVLLFGGVLLLRTFMNLVSTAPGFDPRDTVTIRASIPTPESSDPDRTAACQDALAAAARSLPGVTAAAHAMFIPFTQGLWGDGYRRAGTTDPEPRGPLAHFFMVSPEYLGVMGMPVLQGRGITAADDGKAPHVLVISETFAKRAFPGESPIGQRLEWDGGIWQVAGVTVDVRHTSLGDPVDADAYVPRRQVVRDNTWVVAKTSRPAAAILSELQERAKAIDPDIALTDARTFPQRLSESAAPERFRAIVTGTLAALTLILAIVGLHGVVSYAVEQRTREIGVRIALGQHPASVVRIVLVDTLRTIAVGAVPGLLISVYAGRWLASVVAVNADVSAGLALVVAIFTGAAMIAAAGPAWRASHVDPIVALRS
jgi:putative ABC transport system permease protein